RRDLFFFTSPPCGEVAPVAQRPGREGVNLWQNRPSLFFTSPPCGEVAPVAQRPGREGVNPWLSGRISPEQLDLGARLLQIAQRRLLRRWRRRLPVDRKVDV